MTDPNLPAPTTLGGLLKQQQTRRSLQALLACDDKGLDRFIAVAFQTISRAPHLLKCDPMSLVMAIKDAAALKLSVDGPLGQAWIVPYKGKAQMQLGYRGVVALALRGGSVLSIDAEPVWVWDKYRVIGGSDARVEVESQPPPADADKSKIENIVGAYAVAHLRGGAKKLKWLWQVDLIAARSRSQGYRTALQYGRDDSPWMQHPGAMAAKTAIHRLGKTLELSADDMRALLVEEARDEGRDPIDVQAQAVTPTGDVDLEQLLSAPLDESEMRAADAKYDVSGAVAKQPRDPKGGGRLFAPDPPEDVG